MSPDQLHNYTVVDTVRTINAILALAPLMTLPGYALAWTTNLLDFRQRRFVVRSALAVTLSISVLPILAYLLARVSMYALALVFGALLIVGAVFLARSTKLRRPSKYELYACAALFIWLVVAVATAVDIDTGSELYMPTSVYDHSVRVGILSAIDRDLPPQNPFFANPDAPLRYHYQWILLCALPLKLTSLFSPRALTYAGVFWCGVGLFSLIVLGVKFLLRETVRLERKALFAALFLLVSGLDILPTIFLRWLDGNWQATIDWWNINQITTWTATLLWVPHHLAALIACITGVTLLRYHADTPSRSSVAACILAGFAFASAAGMSIYVTFTFAFACALWVISRARRREWRESVLFASSGLIGLFLALPYLASLTGGGGGKKHFIEVSLRHFQVAFDSARKLGFDITRPPYGKQVGTAVFLPLSYLLELGFFLAIALICLRQLRKWKTLAPHQQAPWYLMFASFFVGSFLRSTTIQMNDLGVRCFLAAQFLLLLWTASLFDTNRSWRDWRKRPWLSSALAVLLLIGVAGTAYELFMVRMYRVTKGHDEGRRTRDLRAVYTSLAASLPPGAVVQNNPVTPDYMPHFYYSAHRFAAGGISCGVAFGGDPQTCTLRVTQLRNLFSISTRPELADTCREFGIDAVVVEASDFIWHVPGSWVWTEQPLVATDTVRAFACTPLRNSPAR